MSWITQCSLLAFLSIATLGCTGEISSNSQSDANTSSGSSIDAHTTVDAVDAALPVLFLDDDDMVGDYRAVFSIPEPGKTDYTIMYEIQKYIDGAVAGSTIHGHITTLSRAFITDALIAAQTRGVEVYTVQNGNPTPESKRLASALGAHHVVCGDTGLDITSCVSTLNGATHHLKDWMFERTVVGGTERSDVTFITSQNLTVSTGEMCNDLFIVEGNQEFYDANLAAFEVFFAQERTDDLYNLPGIGHRLVPSANAEISFAPQTTSPGHTDYDASNDHVALALARVDGFESGCSLDVAHLGLYRSREAVLDQVLRIAALGCKVRIAYTNMNEAAFARLHDKVEMRRADAPEIHSKMMVYRGRYDGVANRAMVWGGSHNMSMGSLRQRDEIFVAISRLALANDYIGYFNGVWARSLASVIPND